MNDRTSNDVASLLAVQQENKRLRGALARIATGTPDLLPPFRADGVTQLRDIAIKALQGSPDETNGELEQLRRIDKAARVYVENRTHGNYSKMCDALFAIPPEEPSGVAREHSREATAPIGRTCGWMRIPDSPDPMDYRMYRFKAGCSGTVATGVHPIYPDVCPACARPVRLLNPSPNDVVRWICPVCSTVNDNRDERCCVGTCKGVRPNPWPPQAVKLVDWNVQAAANPSAAK